jgi:hypothetical protein
MPISTDSDWILYGIISPKVVEDLRIWVIIKIEYLFYLLYVFLEHCDPEIIDWFSNNKYPVPWPQLNPYGIYGECRNIIKFIFYIYQILIILFYFTSLSIKYQNFSHQNTSRRDLSNGYRF